MSETYSVPRNEPVETSINDVHLWRAQDIRISVISESLRMAALPVWKARPLDDAFAGALAFPEYTVPSVLADFCRMLTLISNPVAQKGSQQRNSGPGSRHYVQIGEATIECQEDKRAQQITKGINEKTFALLADIRHEYLNLIRSCALVPDILPIGRQGAWAVYASAQVAVVLRSDVTDVETGARKLTADLNAIASEFIADDVTALRRELVIATQSTAGA